jgi:hypothetical protein
MLLIFLFLPMKISLWEVIWDSLQLCRKFYENGEKLLTEPPNQSSGIPGMSGIPGNPRPRSHKKEQPLWKLQKQKL